MRLPILINTLNQKRVWPREIMHTRMHTCVHTHTHKHTLMQTHTHTHTMHTQHTHIQTYTHIKYTRRQIIYVHTNT